MIKKIAILVIVACVFLVSAADVIITNPKSLTIGMHTEYLVQNAQSFCTFQNNSQWYCFNYKSNSGILDVLLVAIEKNIPIRVFYESRYPSTWDPNCYNIKMLQLLPH